MENNNEILEQLKANEKLLKKQLTSNRIKNIILLLFLCVFVGLSVFAYNTVNTLMADVDQVMTNVDTAMEAVDSIEKLAEQISDEITALDLDAMNSAIKNLDKMSSDMVDTADNLNAASESIKSLFSFGRSSR